MPVSDGEDSATNSQSLVTGVTLPTPATRLERFEAPCLARER
jgi:hypothetical protein